MFGVVLRPLRLRNSHGLQVQYNPPFPVPDLYSDSLVALHIVMPCAGAIAAPPGPCPLRARRLAAPPCVRGMVAGVATVVPQLVRRRVLQGSLMHKPQHMRLAGWVRIPELSIAGLSSLSNVARTIRLGGPMWAFNLSEFHISRLRSFL